MTSDVGLKLRGIGISVSIFTKFQLADVQNHHDKCSHAVLLTGHFSEFGFCSLHGSTSPNDQTGYVLLRNDA